MPRTLPTQSVQPLSPREREIVREARMRALRFTWVLRFLVLVHILAAACWLGERILEHEWFRAPEPESTSTAYPEIVWHHPDWFDGSVLYDTMSFISYTWTDEDGHQTTMPVAVYDSSLEASRTLFELQRHYPVGESPWWIGSAIVNAEPADAFEAAEHGHIAPAPHYGRVVLPGTSWKISFDTMVNPELGCFEENQ